MIEELNRYFYKENTDGQRTHEKMMTIIREIQIKTRMNEISPHTCQNYY